MTEWDEFKEADIQRLRSEMNGNVIVDGRNLFEPEDVAKNGFVYNSIGRTQAFPGFTVSLETELDSSQCEGQEV